jgi:hypothetical protein
MICDSNIFAGNHHGSVGFGRLSLPVAVHAAKIKQRLCHLRLLCASPDAFSALFVSRWAKLSDFSANASAEHTVAPPPNRCHSGCLPLRRRFLFFRSPATAVLWFPCVK